jgi:hypothetical protein
MNAQKTTAMLRAEELPVIRLVNPVTGVELEYQGRWLRPGKATVADVRRGNARWPGDKVWLPLPPGVQKQLEAGKLQVATEYQAREDIAGSGTPESTMPRGNASLEAWRAYAVSQGLSPDDASEMTRGQIRARFTTPAFDPDAPPEASDDGKYEVLG